MDRRWQPETSSGVEHAIEEWLGEGPMHAPDGMLDDFAVALETAPPQRRTTVNRFVGVLSLGGVAAAVVALAVALGVASQFIADGDIRTGGDGCPRLTRVENSVLAPADDPDGERTDVLRAPYVATMGGRLTNGNQIADLALHLDRDWSQEPLTWRLSGPVARDWTTPAGEGSPELGVRLGTPGRYRLSLVGEQSGCRMDVDLRAELDTTLRTYDAERGLTEPPPPDMR